jgi:hypothetical protein
MTRNFVSLSFKTCFIASARWLGDASAGSFLFDIPKMMSLRKSCRVFLVMSMFSNRLLKASISAMSPGSGFWLSKVSRTNSGASCKFSRSIRTAVNEPWRDQCGRSRKLTIRFTETNFAHLARNRDNTNSEQRTLFFSVASNAKHHAFNPVSYVNTATMQPCIECIEKRMLNQNMYTNCPIISLLISM